MVLNDSTSVLLSWTPPSPLGATTGYTISYSGGGSSDSVTVDGGSTNSHTLTGLSGGETYTISVAGTSDHFFSESVNWTINLPEGIYILYLLFIKEKKFCDFPKNY